MVDALVEKSILAAQDYNAKTFVLCGGVACNSRLRVKLKNAMEKKSVSLLIVPPKYCTDNAAMIAKTGFHEDELNYRYAYDDVPIPRLTLN